MSASDYQAAKALKACADFITGSVFEQDGKRWLRKVLLLSRTSYAYGLELERFAEALRLVISRHPATKDLANEVDLEVVTAHRSKGKEADTVIILEAIAKQFPKVHADNQLFRPFGVSIEDTLMEERRLFYVAITRAEHRLLLLTETGQESPYLIGLKLHSRTQHFEAQSDGKKEVASSLGELAEVIDTRLRQLDRTTLIRSNITPAAVSILDHMLSSGYGPPEVPHFEGPLCAEFAWPKANPPVAVLTGPRRKEAAVWSDRGWQVYPV